MGRRFSGIYDALDRNGPASSRGRIRTLAGTQEGAVKTAAELYKTAKRDKEAAGRAPKQPGSKEAFDAATTAFTTAERNFNDAYSTYKDHMIANHQVPYPKEHYLD